MRNHVRPTRRALAVALALTASVLAAGTAAIGGTAGATPTARAQAPTTVDPTTTTTGSTTTPSRPATTLPTPSTTRRGNELCRHRSQVPPKLWRLLVRLFDLRCTPHQPTTTTTTTTTRPGEVQDCGRFDTATGWPTTFARPRNDCLLNAFAAGTPARYVLLTAPAPGDTRRVAHIYEVIGVQRVRVTDDPTNWGGTTVTVSECTGLTDNGFSLTGTGCTVVETRSVPVAPTETRLVLTPTGPIVAGQPVTITATVVTGSGAPVTTGSVSLLEGNDARGTLRVGTDGTAAFPVTRGVGIWYFHARYNGSAGFAPSTSDAVRFEVVPA